MGLLADAALAAGGQVVGVIPHALWEREVGHRGLTDTRIVDTMHERKALMADLSDAFVALPGGAGTLEELFEAWTWAQLGIHAKPVGILNVGGYFSPLLAFLENAVRAGFLHRRYADMLLVSEDPEDLLGRLGAYEAPSVPQWLTRGQE